MKLEPEQFRARPVFVGGLSIAIGAAGSGWRRPIDIQKRTSFHSPSRRELAARFL